MKASKWQIVAFLVGVPAAVIAVPLAYSTSRGYLQWYRLVGGCQVLLDDPPKSAECWAHCSLAGDAALLSLRRGDAVTTYVLMPESGIAISRDPVERWLLWLEGDVLPPQLAVLPPSEKVAWSRSGDGSVQLKLKDGILRVTLPESIRLGFK